MRATTQQVCQHAAGETLLRILMNSIFTEQLFHASVGNSAWHCCVKISLLLPGQVCYCSMLSKVTRLWFNCCSIGCWFQHNRIPRYLLIMNSKTHPEHCSLSHTHGHGHGDTDTDTDTHTHTHVHARTNRHTARCLLVMSETVKNAPGCAPVCVCVCASQRCPWCIPVVSKHTAQHYCLECLEVKGNSHLEQHSASSLGPARSCHWGLRPQSADG